MKWFVFFCLFSLSTLLVIQPVKVELNRVEATNPQEIERLRRENKILERMVKQCDRYEGKALRKW